MIEQLEVETYLYVTLNKFEIYTFDKNRLINLYKAEYEFENTTENLQINFLSDFLENNIFKIEKLIGKFVKNIFLVLESDKVTNFYLGIKKKNYNNIINQKYIENILTEAKDLFKENYYDQNIMHILVNNYIINDSKYSSFVKNLQGDNISLEIQFICIPNNVVSMLDKTLEKFQIKIIKCIDGNYMKNFFRRTSLTFEKMVCEIKSGCNENEIILVPKTIKNKGFFEKFFQLFS